MATPGFAETSAFIAVIECKSFSKAAKLLGLSPVTRQRNGAQARG